MPIQDLIAESGLLERHFGLFARHAQHVAPAVLPYLEPDTILSTNDPAREMDAFGLKAEKEFWEFTLIWI